MHVQRFVQHIVASPESSNEIWWLVILEREDALSCCGNEFGGAWFRVVLQDGVFGVGVALMIGALWVDVCP